MLLPKNKECKSIHDEDHELNSDESSVESAFTNTGGGSISTGSFYCTKLKSLSRPTSRNSVYTNVSCESSLGFCGNSSFNNLNQNFDDLGCLVFENDAGEPLQIEISSLYLSQQSSASCNSIKDALTFGTISEDISLDSDIEEHSTSDDVDEAQIAQLLSGLQVTSQPHVEEQERPSLASHGKEIHRHRRVPSGSSNPLRPFNMPTLSTTLRGDLRKELRQQDSIRHIDGDTKRRHVRSSKYYEKQSRSNRKTNVFLKDDSNFKGLVTTLKKNDSLTRIGNHGRVVKTVQADHHSAARSSFRVARTA